MNKKSVQNSLKPVGYSLWVVGVFLIATQGMIAFIRYCASDEMKTWLTSPVGSTALSVVLYAAIIAIVLVPLFAKNVWGQKLAERLGLTKFSGRHMIVWALFAWGLSIIVSVIVVAVLYWIHIPGLDLGQSQDIGVQADTSTGWVGYVLAFLLLVVVAPFMEELLFRGYLFKQLRENGSFMYSTILTSLAFAGLHFQPNVVINVFILSIFLCYLREKFDSIWAGVMVHAFKNGLAYALLFILPLYGISLM